MSSSGEVLYGGVETGGTKVNLILAGGPDQIVAEEQFPTTVPDETIPRIIEFFEQHERPVAIGIAAFGPVGVDPDAPDWGVVGTTPKIPWRQAPLGPAIRDALKVPVALHSDVTVAGLGEARWGAAQGDRSVCYITVGTGIGAGFIIDGQLLRGLMHPEAGHIRIPHDLARDPFPGDCPSHGDCWEGLACGKAMQDRWGVPAGELAEDHPAWALEAEYLAAGIFNLIAVVSPQRFIVGGGVAAHPGLLEQVRARVVELNAGYLDLSALTAAGIERYLVAPALGGRAGTLGAIALAQTVA